MDPNVMAVFRQAEPAQVHGGAAVFVQRGRQYSRANKLVTEQAARHHGWREPVVSPT